MTLSYVWSFFFIVGIAVIGVRYFVGDADIIKTSVENLFSMSKTAIDIAIGLIGIMTLFLGIMRIGEKAGAVNLLSKWVGPFFRILFPEVPKNHPAIGHMMMNFSANLLGLDNAATPFGLKAMESLQEINPDKERASNAQIMFTVLLASGLTLIPVSVIAQRAILGAKDPTDIFFGTLFATSVATFAGIIIVSLYQRINLFKPVFLMGSGAIILFFSLVIYWVSHADKETIEPIVSSFSNGLILMLFFVFILGGLIKKQNLFENFIEGAKEGFTISVKIMPYLVAMLAAISVLRTSGVLEFITLGIGEIVALFGADTSFVEALPTALMKPVSGSGARALMIETMTTHGADSFVGRLSCIFQGTTDTTFYILALYFGSVGINKARYSLQAALLAELAGVIAAIAIAYLMYYP